MPVGGCTNLIMLSAIPLFVIHMLRPGILKVEMSIALLGIVVILALHIVLRQCVIDLEVVGAVKFLQERYKCHGSLRWK